MRGYYVDAPAAEKIALRARAPAGARRNAQRLTPWARNPTTGPAYDLLADLAAVVTEPKMWSETVVARLAEAPARRLRRGPLEPEPRAN